VRLQINYTDVTSRHASYQSPDNYSRKISVFWAAENIAKTFFSSFLKRSTFFSNIKEPETAKKKFVSYTL